MTSDGGHIQDDFGWFSGPLRQLSPHTGESALQPPPMMPNALPHSSYSPLTLQGKAEWIRATLRRSTGRTLRVPLKEKKEKKSGTLKWNHRSKPSAIFTDKAAGSSVWHEDWAHINLNRKRQKIVFVPQGLNRKENTHQEHPHTGMGHVKATQSPRAATQGGTFLMRGDCAAPPLARALWCFSAESEEYIR